MRALALVIGLVVLLTAPAPAVAQGRKVRVQGVRPLTFGVLLGGTPTSILRTDPANSGQIDIAAQNNDVVIVTFSLPNAMTGPASASMPLTFTGNDAGFSAQQSVSDQVAFDPRQSYMAVMSRTGRASVYLGGTVSPAVNQPPGAYAATITLTVVYP